jgi:sporulation protein YtfJ
MKTAMESIKDMVDVNTIVGDAVQAPDGTVIIPISRVAFGFAAGGGEYSQAAESGNSEGNDDEDENDEKQENKFPFAGGSGAGVSINPVAFMIVGQGQIKLLPVNINSSVDKILDLIPELLSNANETLKRRINVKREFKKGECFERKEKTKNIREDDED